MTKKSSSASTENPDSDNLSENNDAMDVAAVVDTGVDETVAETVTPAKKKVATRKKAATGEAKVKKTPVKRTRSTKSSKADNSANAPVMKAFWGVYNPMMVQVAQYSYADEADARKAAEDMTEKKKAPHFVQLIKKVM